MRFSQFQGLRGRLSYANVMATVAFFFALTGASMAGVKYLAAGDVIPASSDLAGSTYGNPLITAGKVATGKLADGAVTSSKLGVSARMWAKIHWDDSTRTATVVAASKPGVTTIYDGDDAAIGVNFGAGTPDLNSCAAVVTPSNRGFSYGVETFGSSDFVFMQDEVGNWVVDSFDIAVFC
jgi:hypothetical protein